MAYVPPPRPGSSGVGGRRYHMSKNRGIFDAELYALMQAQISIPRISQTCIPRMPQICISRI